MKSVDPILRNAGALAASQIIIKALNIVVSVMMVRWLGAQNLGRYSYILAFCYPFGAVADFGLATLAIRDISQDRRRETVVLATLRRLLVTLTTLSSFALLTTAALTRHDAVTFLGIAVVALSSLLSVLTTPFLVALTAREQLHLLSLYRICAALLGSLATLTVLLAGGTVLPLLLSAAGVNVLMLGIARLLAGNPGPPVRTTLPGQLSMLRKAVPFGCLMVGFALYYRVDMIMLEWLRGPQEVGLYAAAYRFLDAVMLLAASLGGPFFPRFSNLIASNPGKVRELLEAMWRPLFALGLPLSLGVFLVSDQLVLVLFGREFAGAGRLTAVLIWGTLPLFWVNVANHALNAADRVWSLAAVYGISSMVNIAGNLILIPMFGGLGASLATLFCEWLNLVLIIGLIRRHFGVSFSAEGLWRYALASAGLACALWMTRGYGLAAELLLGGLAYVGGLFFLGYARSADMLAVKQLLIQ